MKLYDKSIKSGWFEVTYLPASGGLRIKFAKVFALDKSAIESQIKAKELVQKVITKDDFSKNIKDPSVFQELIQKAISDGRISIDEVINLDTAELNKIQDAETVEAEVYAKLDLFKSMINKEQIADKKIAELIELDVKSDFWLNQDYEAIKGELNSFRNKYSK